MDGLRDVIVGSRQVIAIAAAKKKKNTRLPSAINGVFSNRWNGLSLVSSETNEMQEN